MSYKAFILEASRIALHTNVHIVHYFVALKAVPKFDYDDSQTMNTPPSHPASSFVILSGVKNLLNEAKNPSEQFCWKIQQAWPAFLFYKKSILEIPHRPPN